MSLYCLTDIHISPTNHNAFLQDWGNEIIINSFSSESRGVSILLGDNLEYKILEVEKDYVGNLLICFYQEYTILLVVLYGPNIWTGILYKILKLIPLDTKGKTIQRQKLKYK